MRDKASAPLTSSVGRLQQAKGHMWAAATAVGRMKRWRSRSVTCCESSSRNQSKHTSTTAWGPDEKCLQKNAPLRRSIDAGSEKSDVSCGPTLMGSPRGVKRGSLRVSCGLVDLSAGERESTSPAAQMAFEELSLRLPVLVRQACTTMDELIATIRERHVDDRRRNLERHLGDASFLAHAPNKRILAHIVREVSSTSYHFAKWCHELEPLSFALPSKPPKAVDSSVGDLLWQLQSCVSRMQCNASNLCPLLEQIVRQSVLAQSGTADALAQSPWDIAQKRGLIPCELLGLAAHLEHLLLNTQQLAYTRAFAPAPQRRYSSAPAVQDRPSDAPERQRSSSKQSSKSA